MSAAYWCLNIGPTNLNLNYWLARPNIVCQWIHYFPYPLCASPLTPNSLDHSSTLTANSTLKIIILCLLYIFTERCILAVDHSEMEMKNGRTPSDWTWWEQTKYFASFPRYDVLFYCVFAIILLYIMYMIYHLLGYVYFLGNVKKKYSMWLWKSLFTWNEVVVMVALEEPENTMCSNIHHTCQLRTIHICKIMTKN